MRLNFLIVISILFVHSLIAQNVKIEGYIFEEDNRGYLNMAKVIIKDKETGFVFSDTYSDIEGYFSANVPANATLMVTATKDMFSEIEEVINTKLGEKVFLSFKMKRLPGYIFEITMAEKRDNEDVVVGAIKGASIEVYNNTLKKTVLSLIDHPSHEFQLQLLKGNHYTILIRKQGYLAKRMEAYVNVNGCILCFEGIGSLRPGVVDNLSSNNEIGVLLANVELDKVYEGKLIGLKNIYYSLGKADITENSKKELDKVAVIAKDNPNIIFELGSHTDSRGSSDANFALSNKRAEAVVDYLVNKKDVRKKQLVSRGYGETTLVNKCGDNVICTEAQHAENRRTELKILGIEGLDESKSLAQIKAVEEFEASLFEQIYGEQQNGHDKMDIKQDTLIKLVPAVNKNVEKEEVIIEEKLMPEILKINADSIYKEKLTSIENSGNDDLKKVDQSMAMIDPEILDERTVTTETYRVKCGTFKYKNNGEHLQNKILLLGYPKAELKKEEEFFIVIAASFQSIIYAQEAQMHLDKNDIECIVEQL